MAQSDSAVDLVDSLDRALASILPLADILEQPLAERSSEDVERSVQAYATAAQQLQALLSRAHSTGKTPLQAAKQEERELREELAAKEELLQTCAVRLTEWQARCECLAAEHRAAAAL
ncbi:hypothetical protein WJX81_002225 [Elliptochloris bilobata]|uniref:Mediator of RNA polymerase II transcription subunit 9 n=1 Tax=Elliptochloris bilobata TaxID=381761 RepID=A0AAW1S8U0_9CHLO